MNIRSSTETDQIAPALVKAHAEVRRAAKSGQNRFGGYNYANLEDIMSATREALRGNDMCILESAAEINLESPAETRPTKKGGTEYVERVSLTLRLVHVSGQFYEVDCPGVGQDVGDKGIYQAITGARKYGMCLLMGVVTTDDPEDDSNEQPASAPRRATAQPTDAKKPSVRVEFYNAIAEFANIDPSEKTDVVSACNQFAKAHGVLSVKQATDDQVSTLLNEVIKAVAAGKSFADATTKEAA